MLSYKVLLMLTHVAAVYSFSILCNVRSYYTATGYSLQKGVMLFPELLHCFNQCYMHLLVHMSLRVSWNTVFGSFPVHPLNFARKLQPVFSVVVPVSHSHQQKDRRDSGDTHVLQHFPLSDFLSSDN